MDYTFVNRPVALRSKRIPEETWERHKGQICFLYESATLEQVATLMTVRHGFSATPRQYNHQLAKWGIKKYNTTSTNHHLVPQTPPIPEEASSHHGRPKRSRSAASNSSDEQSPASTDQDPKPPRKRGNNAISVASPGSKEVSRPDFQFTEEEASTSADDAISLATEWSILAPGSTRAPPDDEASPPTSPNLTIHIVDFDAPQPGDLMRGVFAERDAASLDRSSHLSSSTIASIPPEPALTVPGAARTIDRDQPVDNLSARDIADLKRAADYFAVFSYNREAFELYTLLLKYQLSKPSRRDDGFWYLVVQCVHTATRLEHIEIMQHILRHERRRVRVSEYGSSTYMFLIHMLMAYTSYPTSGIKGVEESMVFARSFAGREPETLLFWLPLNERAIDLVIYRNLLRLQDSCDLVAPETFHLNRDDEFSALSAERFLEDLMLHTAPGPFEVQLDATMENSCVRSCLDWCASQLPGLGSVEMPQHVLGAPEDENLTLFWTQVDSLFFAMWEMWCATAEPTEPWMTQTQETMGISPSELLFLVCRTIHQENYCLAGACCGWANASRGTNLVRHCISAARFLQSQPDAELARAVLRQYVSRNTVRTTPKWRVALQSARRQRIFAHIEKAVSVSFTGLGQDLRRPVSSILNQPETPIPSWNVPLLPNGYAAPTIASSLSSGDLSSFRRMRRAAERRVRAFKDAAAAPSMGSSGAPSDRSRRPASVVEITDSLRSVTLSGWTQDRDSNLSSTSSCVIRVIDEGTAETASSEHNLI